MQNILVFRFANRVLEPMLTDATSTHVQITVAETLGLEGRYRYYDGIGALRDMLQSHLMQLLTLTAMEPPADLGQRDPARPQGRGPALSPALHGRRDRGARTRSEASTLPAR